jgi:integrase
VTEPHAIQAPQRPAGLLAKLMAAVRPEFRADDLVFDPRDPVFGGPACAVSGCVRPARQRGMCLGHRQRWLAAGKPASAEFASATSPDWHGHSPLRSCQVTGCRYGQVSRGMCERHAGQWGRAGRPELAAWRGSRAPLPAPSPPPRACRIGYCQLWARGTSPFCSTHEARWNRRGRPDAEEFAASCEDPGSGAEHIDLRRLPAQLRLEVQYVLQCRRDEAKAKIVPAVAQRIVHALAATDVTSLLDRPEQVWEQFGPPPGSREKGWRAFVLDARRRVEAIAYGRGWDVEYPRDLWRLRNLGVDHRVATISFAQIPQPWLKELAKRWARWQLTTGLGAGSVADGARALTRFGAFLACPPVAVDRLAQVDRPLLERYLADLHAELAGRACHSYHLGSLNAFLRAIRQHRWDDTLPASALIFPEDFPKRGEKLPRALAEHVMAQVERPANLDRWDNPAYRLITLILIRCGLRISDAVKVGYDCVVTDAADAPYLRYHNHKMKREALVPIDDEVHQEIGRQQRRVLARWPKGTPVLFPRPNANLRGHRPIAANTYRSALDQWLERCEVRDEHGRPVHLTPHQWRHSLGTTMINKDVPQEVVRRILDHDSHAMTAHYARLSDTTIRRHWEAARKVNTQGETVSLDPGGALADAAWAKQRLSRTTQALPNGFCGLPLARTCPHANACLTCPMFLTTAEFLPQHRQQHQQTLQIISAAEGRGQARLAEMNRQVADNLEKIITALEDDGGGDQQRKAAADAS